LSPNGIRARSRVKQIRRLQKPRPGSRGSTSATGTRTGTRDRIRDGGRSWIRTAAAIVCILAAAAAGAASGSPLGIDGRRASGAVVLTLGAHEHAARLARSPMLSELAGVTGVLDARSIAALAAGAGDPLPIPASAERVGTIVLERGARTARRAIVMLDDARVAIVDTNDPDRDPIRAAPVRIADLGALGIDTIRLTAQVPEDIRAWIDADRWTGPTRPSPVQIVGVTHRVRLGREIEPRRRRPEPPRIRIRLPERDAPAPERATGLLIWISDTPSGRIPEPIARGCDALGLVALGLDHCGDALPHADRAQLVLDALASVSSALTLDRGRVYIAGFSGGARLASMMQLAFPDIFAGALAIGGLATHDDAPTGAGRTGWGEDLAAPSRHARELLASRRLGVIAGSVDFALPEVRDRAAALDDDPIRVRLEIVEGLAHAIPAGTACAHLLAWIDDGAADARRERARRARVLLDRVVSTYAPDPADDPRGRRLLIEVTTIAPWSDPAWDAAALLGFERD